MFVAIGAFLIIYNSHIFYSVADDLSFYSKFVEGHFVWHGLPSAESGRFFPLGGISINFASLFSISPYSFMIVNAILFSISACVFLYLLDSSGVSVKFAFFAFSIAVLSLGMSNIFTMICYPEVPQIAFIMAFLFFAMRFYRTSKIFHAILALIFANAALYLKEVTFVIIGGFGFFHLIFSYLNKEKIHKFFDCALMLSAIIFLLCYLFFTYGGERNYIDSAKYLASNLKIVLIILFGTPSIIALWASVAYRIFMVLKHKHKFNSFFDVIGLVASLYVAAYISLGFASLYYYTPAVLLGMAYLAFFIHTYPSIFKNLVFKILSFIIIFLLVSSSFPLGVHQYTRNKFQNQNAQKAMEFLSNYINSHKEKTILYFDNFGRGVNPIWESYAYAIWFDSLKSIFKAENFDVKSSIPIKNGFVIKKDSPYSLYSKIEPDIPQSGDLVILSFFGNITTTKERFDFLQENYELIFKSENPLYFPAYSLPYIISEWLDKRGIARPLSYRGNLFALPSEFLIFKVR